MHIRKACGIAALMLVLSVGSVPQATAERATAPALVVSTATELKNALVPANGGRRIHVRAGVYVVDRALTVPDGATLEGEGVMVGGQLPAGFAPGSETRIVASSVFDGDLLTLGDATSIRGLAIEDVAGRMGDAVGVGSRRPRDRLSASIFECQIVNPSPLRPPGPSGPVGDGVVILTRNLNGPAAPGPDLDAVVELHIKRSILRALGHPIFVANFAAGGRVNLDLDRNLIVGTLEVNGGISRPETVVNAITTLDSHANVFMPPRQTGVGWQVGGGSAAPIPGSTNGATSNQVRVRSEHDRIEGAQAGIVAFAGRRLNTVVGLSSDNSVELDLHGLTIQTSGPMATDLDLVAALSFGTFAAGDRNILRVNMHGATGSGARRNSYSNASAPQFTAGNRLEFIGSRRAFLASNDAIDPVPAAEFFLSGR
jgi:hypothetical protein